MSANLIYGTETFNLDESADVGRLQREIEEAVRAGGGWVDIPGRRGGSIFVSAGQHIRVAKPGQR